MKEAAIKKINTIGKVSYIAAVIAKVFVIVGTAEQCLVISRRCAVVVVHGNVVYGIVALL